MEVDSEGVDNTSNVIDTAYSREVNSLVRNKMNKFFATLNRGEMGTKYNIEQQILKLKKQKRTTQKRRQRIQEYIRKYSAELEHCETIMENINQQLSILKDKLKANPETPESSPENNLK